MVYWKQAAVKRWWRTTSNENGNYQIGWETWPTIWDLLFFKEPKIYEYELRNDTWYDKKTGKYATRDIATLLDMNKAMYSMIYDDFV